jgi:hypothetical protein
VKTLPPEWLRALRADGVLPELLGIERILSEDAVRRGLAAIKEAEGTAWLPRHLDHCTEPLLGEGWVLDADRRFRAGTMWELGVRLASRGPG